MDVCVSPFPIAASGPEQTPFASCSMTVTTSLARLPQKLFDVALSVRTVSLTALRCMPPCPSAASIAALSARPAWWMSSTPPSDPSTSTYPNRSYRMTLPGSWRTLMRLVGRTSPPRSLRISFPRFSNDTHCCSSMRFSSSMPRHSSVTGLTWAARSSIQLSMLSSSASSPSSVRKRSLRLMASTRPVPPPSFSPGPAGGRSPPPSAEWCFSSSHEMRRRHVSFSRSFILCWSALTRESAVADASATARPSAVCSSCRHRAALRTSAASDFSSSFAKRATRL
mmetsp:Transcript_22851/g.53889  ORF Transcript_22851/g.53889 Transcript_22851/m.53889 type:complete len:282 (-) Transcript_22851:53-898(-)